MLHTEMCSHGSLIHAYEIKALAVVEKEKHSSMYPIMHFLFTFKMSNGREKKILFNEEMYKSCACGKIIEKFPPVSNWLCLTKMKRINKFIMMLMCRNTRLNKQVNNMRFMLCLSLICKLLLPVMMLEVWMFRGFLQSSMIDQTQYVVLTFLLEIKTLRKSGNVSTSDEWVNCIKVGKNILWITYTVKNMLLHYYKFHWNPIATTVFMKI